jgi:hypothetical protein
MVEVRRRTFMKLDDTILPALNDFFGDICKAISLISLGPSTHDIEIADSGTANSDIVVSHNLRKSPRGYVVLYQDKAGSLYVSAWDDSTATFKFSTANTNIKIRLFS